MNITNVDISFILFQLHPELGVSGQLHAPAALPPGKEPPVPIG
jgi:hypothetical protein